MDSKESVSHSVASDFLQWILAHHAPMSMGFSRQEDWSWLPFSSSRDGPNPGMEVGFPALKADSLI